MQQTTPRTYAHGVTHTRPIVANGTHFNAANDDLTGRPILRGDGGFSEAWARADARHWRYSCAVRGECSACGFKLPRHEDGCKNAPDEGDDE